MISEQTFNVSNQIFEETMYGQGLSIQVADIIGLLSANTLHNLNCLHRYMHKVSKLKTETQDESHFN